MRGILRLVTFFAPIVFFLNPFFAAAQSVTYPSCKNDAGCNAGEYCTFVQNSGSSTGTCKLPANILPNETSSYAPPPSASNNYNNNNNGGCPAGTVPSGTHCVTPTSQSSGGIDARYLQGYAASIINIINSLVAPVLLAIAFIFFLFGVYRYFILGAASDTERATGRQFILWGIIGFVVIFSLWGIVAMVGNTFNLTAGGNAPAYPTL
ncbi:MAG: pilin [Minisyncoccota bacterium]